MVDSHYESLLNRTVSRYTQSVSSNALGEDIVTMTYSVSGIKCRLVPITAEQLKELPGEFEDIKFTGYFLSSQTLTTDDELHYGGNIYRVREVYDDSGGYVRKALLGIK